MPVSVIEDFLLRGRVAFFFDGLDEVGDLEKRALILAEITRLMADNARLGSRFALTSRPAAIQPVDVPDGLVRIQLRGLTDSEIAQLATRVITNRIGDGDGADEDAKSVVNRLIADVQSRPGIARIARNPLLLTLLVLVYANSGALSAKRHVIYTQAIKTLVSVRGREVRHPISEADLRTTLGTVAVNILSRTIEEIPRRDDVVKVIAGAKGSGEDVAQDLAEASSFLQEIAETTGLLSIHVSQLGARESYVTFMHHSFLEYYAAAGLMQKDFLAKVSILARGHRWHDVATLLVGLLSEQSDVTPLIKRILDCEDTSGVSLYPLLLALDGAAECDVPPRATQEVLAKAVFDGVSQGSARHSSELRSEISERVATLLTGGSQHFASALLRGLGDSDSVVRAAFVDLVSKIRQDGTAGTEICNAVKACYAIDNSSLRTALIMALTSREDFWDDRAIPVIRRALRGSFPEKHAGLTLLNTKVSLAAHFRGELRDLLSERNPAIETRAAWCLLHEAIRLPDQRDPVIIERCLRAVANSDDDEPRLHDGLTIELSTLESLLDSANPRFEEMAIRFLPWVKGEGGAIYRLLSARIRSDAPGIVASSLSSLRGCRSALSLLTLADVDLLCEFSGDESKSKDVTIEAIKTLGEVPGDSQVINILKRKISRKGSSPKDSREVLESARSISRHVQRVPRLREEVLEAVLRSLHIDPRAGFGDERNQQHTESLLLACEAIGGLASAGELSKIKKAAEYRRTPVGVRRGAIRAFGRLAVPDAHSARAIIEFLNEDDPRVNRSAYLAARFFVENCRRRVRYYRDSMPQISALRGALRHCWSREAARSREEINSPGMEDLRAAIVALDSLSVAYGDFSERARPA